MSTSRTGTATWLRHAAQAKREAQARGLARCPLCGVWMDYDTGKRPNSAEADHIRPHSLGGSDDIDNIRVICRRCNQSRGNGLKRPGRQRQRPIKRIELAKPARSGAFPAPPA